MKNLKINHPLGVRKFTPEKALLIERCNQLVELFENDSAQDDRYAKYALYFQRKIERIENSCKYMRS